MMKEARRRSQEEPGGPTPGGAAQAPAAPPCGVEGPRPFASFSSPNPSSRRPKPRGYLAKSYSRRGENTREKELSAESAGEIPPGGEIDAIVTVIELDIIAITIIIISTIITAVITAGHHHRRSNLEEIKELEAQVLSLKKDLEKRHEGKSTLDKMLSVQQSPNDKSGLGFNSNNKNKSKSKNNKKKGQDKVNDSAKLVCFKCKVEGHHVRSCPLKKKKHLSEKQQGKRPQGQGQAHARPQVEDRPLPKKNQDIVPQEKKSIKKRKGNTCYLCREKGHFASSCLGSTLSNPIIVDDDYSLGKDKDGNVFAKFVGTQSGLKKRTIWVAKPIVTNLLGPNLVGDQQAQT
ncbi:hypothetical protein QYE76_039434 [Lolium multiflorum]|uniref:CCHC-type domain-containing protein n=1 Tax=Lolium multiflorum TaxID=4521 RepID=A0AAD8WTV9_LOLMU|nr:hypothetical protein QYE76_039434 [Lolium multiflorum]